MQPEKARPDDDRYLDLEALAAYSGLSTKSLRRAFTAAGNPLRHTVVRPTGTGRGKVLVRKSDFDQWMANQPAAVSVREVQELREARAAQASGPDLSWMRRK